MQYQERSLSEQVTENEQFTLYQEMETFQEKA